MWGYLSKFNSLAALKKKKMRLDWTTPWVQEELHKTQLYMPARVSTELLTATKTDKCTPTSFGDKMMKLFVDTWYEIVFETV